MSWDAPNRSIPSQKLVSLAVPCTDINPLDFLRQALGESRVYFADETTAYVGVGVCADLKGWNGRFQSITQQTRDLFADAHLPTDAPKFTQPRLFGGFAFRDDFIPDNTWSIHHPAQFILPHFQLAKKGDETWLTMNVLVEEVTEELVNELKKELEVRSLELGETLSSLIPHPSSFNTQSPISINYPLSNESWISMISNATAKMKNGAFEKVVLSRMCELRFEGKVSADIALAYLEQAYPTCYRFLFEPRPNHAFIGATPERLVKVDDGNLEADALAGTAQKANSPEEYEQFGQDLLASEKNLFEHRLVVESIIGRLRPYTSTTNHNNQPILRKLTAIQHLHTPIFAKLNDTHTILDLLAQLHPTPALGGKPRDKALAYIRDTEPVPRGWFGAPIGIIDANLDGQFAVAIRSAITDNNRAWLYAGAGIVANSNPQSEWEETGLKFTPMLKAFGAMA